MLPEIPPSRGIGNSNRRTAFKIQIPQSFVDWALEVLKEENKKESADRNTIIASLQRDYTAQIKKVDSLIDIRARGFVNDDELVKTKQESEKEKRRIQELLNDADNRVGV